MSEMRAARNSVSGLYFQRFVRACLALGTLGVVAWIVSGYLLPDPLFDTPLSHIILDRDGKLLGASIASDRQWRFPLNAAVPEKIRQAMLCYEDKRFYHHFGVDPLAVLRALRDDILQHRIVSGASTITMQVIRLARHGRPRTITEKLIEMCLAVRLEFSKSKREILSLYAANAPFGGNIVGMEAASWRYFGRKPSELSWAESAMLAVLPNTPALIHPGRNRQRLIEKRNQLLDRMHSAGIIDDLTCRLAKKELLPPAPYPLPMSAPHLLRRILKSGSAHEMHSSGYRIQTTLIKNIQDRATAILEQYYRSYSGNGVYNAAALILEVQSGAVVAYVGNIPEFSKAKHGNYVDIVTAPRSTGSILKPLLYASMLYSGELLPDQLVPDIPTRMGDFAPLNYSRTYSGAVPASLALARSLNIPAVRMLHAYGVDRFYTQLKRFGMTTLYRPARGYGLSLILGGAEGTLWDITGIYAGMARCLNNYFLVNPDQNVFRPAHYLLDTPSPQANSRAGKTPVDAASCSLTFEAMLEVTRPGVENAWREFSSSRKIAWKTGTSYGNRDAWAIGVTPRYAVGVWVGNADGAGRSGLTGITYAAPILFDLFDLLDDQSWFRRPDAELVRVKVCARSGYRAGVNCAETREALIPRTGLRSKLCPYCKLVHCDKNLKWRVNSACEQVRNIRTEKWFVLPPAMEWYYKNKHSDYRTLPPYRADCLKSLETEGHGAISIIYPDRSNRIYIPLELRGRRGRTVFKAATRNPQTRIFWHLDSEYLGETQDMHEMSAAPAPGEHVLTLVDENGEFVQRRFTVLAR